MPYASNQTGRLPPKSQAARTKDARPRSPAMRARLPGARSGTTGNQGGAANVKYGMRPHTKLGAVLLSLVVAGACSSSAGRVVTGQSGAGGSGPATVSSSTTVLTTTSSSTAVSSSTTVLITTSSSTAVSSSTTASSLTTGTSATTATATAGSSSNLGSSAGRISPPPAGWKAVWYDGVGADIPASWEVASGTSFVCSFGATPMAYLGLTHMFYPCPMPAPGRPGNNGLWIDASYGAPGASMIETSVQGIAVDIGLAPDPIVAHRIEASLRYDPAAPDPAT
jgi:hypothetical protein